MRKAHAILLTMTTAITVGGLSACSPASTDSFGSCEPEVLSGDQAALVSVSDNVGEEPDVSFPTPIYTETTEAQVIFEGTGNSVQPDAPLTIRWSIYNGRTGEFVTTTGYIEAVGPSLPSGLLPGMVNALECQHEGTRISMVLSPADAFESAGGNPQWGIEANDSIVVVADVVQAFLIGANGIHQPDFQAGLPSVVTGDNGEPGFTIPSTSAPTEHRIATLQKGTGDTIAAGDSVMVQYTGLTWAEQTVFDSTWESGQPAIMPLSDVVPGFRDALVGQTVGSRVLSVIPPELGYGAEAQGTIPANSTLIFAIDILGIMPAA